MLRGTQLLVGDQALLHHSIIQKLGNHLTTMGFQPIVVPEIFEQELFIQKAGPEIVNQMWAFNDKANRAVCLIPEVTAIIQQQYRDNWSKNQKLPMKLFYVNRCYRYDRPQKGRYREFTQFGIEILGPLDYKQEAQQLLSSSLDLFGVNYKFCPNVKRGLHYYTENGFEVECETLGAQKQIAGGGSYAEGCGWAIGVDRLRLVLSQQE